MNKALSIITIAAVAATGLAGTELVTNGDFESGNIDGWQYLATGGSTLDLTSDAASGNFAVELFNDADASAAILRQNNIGAGMLNTGDTIEISFTLKGSGAVGGVAFAELFTEIAGGGVSSTQFVGGAPLAVGSNYAVYSASVDLNAVVSGGVSLSFVAVTGAEPLSESRLFIDDVSITIPGGSCNAADVAEPFGILDLSDISTFVSAFVSMDPIADIDQNSVYDLTDITSFVGLFTGGCP